MRFIVLPTLAGLFVLSGCGQASANTLDPQNDVHCSVLASYFHGFAEFKKAPRNQQLATKVLHEWYAAKVRAVAGERFKDFAVMQTEIEPLLKAVKADPLSMGDELTACTERATVDPAFNRFAGTYMR